MTTTILTVKVPTILAQQVKQLAVRGDQTVSRFIRQALRNQIRIERSYLKAKQRANGKPTD